jgi:hypothetical protein
MMNKRSEIMMGKTNKGFPGKRSDTLGTSKQEEGRVLSQTRPVNNFPRTLLPLL